MKKTLLTMAALAFGFTSMFAADIVETNKDFTAADDSWMPTSMSGTEQEKTSTKTNLKWKFLQVCSAKANSVINFQFNKNVSAYMETTPGIECEKIILNVTSAGSKGGIDVYVGETSIVHQDVLKGGEFTFDIPAAYQTATTAFKIMNTKKSGASTGNQINIHSITFKEKEVGGLLDSQLAFEKPEYEFKLGESFESPVATTVSDGAVTYASSNDAIAKVNAETGELELVARGTATITATVAETETYKADEASYRLTVIDPNYVPPFTDINTTTLVGEGSGTGYAVDRYLNDATLGVSFYGKYNNSNGMQFNQGSSSTSNTGNGVIMTANPNKYKIESIDFEFYSDSNESNKLVLYASNVPYTKVESQEGVLISDAIAKGSADNNYTTTVSFSGLDSDYTYFSMMAPKTVVISNIRVNWVAERSALPSVPTLKWDADNKQFEINVDHGYHIHWSITRTGGAEKAAGEENWTVVEDHNAVVPVTDIDAAETVVLKARTVHPEDANNYVEEKITVAPEGVTVGVENIEAEENVAPVYYNLQGVRVANPQNGLYIQVKGGKSSKVLVK